MDSEHSRNTATSHHVEPPTVTASQSSAFSDLRLSHRPRPGLRHGFLHTDSTAASSGKVGVSFSTKNHRGSTWGGGGWVVWGNGRGCEWGAVQRQNGQRESGIRPRSQDGHAHTHYQNACFKSQLCLFQLPGRQQRIIAQNLGSLPPTWET